MKNLKALFLILIVSFSTISCFQDNDDNLITASEINDFIWKGMNVFYLYKAEIPNLADDRFSSNAEYADYLNSYSNPFDLFESLIHERQTVDRFSWIVDDYIALEQQFQGTSTVNGMEFTLFYAPNSTTEVIGVVRLVLPNSSADSNGVERGDIFYGIDGTILNENNFSQLLNQESYTINIGVFDDNGTPETNDDSIVPTGETISLTKTVYTENPIYQTQIFNVGGENVGYLMYNGFTAGSENALNTVFGDFKSNNVQHLVLDLRYNPGGSVTTTTYLASMITGQFSGEVFEKLIFNENFQSENTDYLFETQLQNGNAINSLNLSKLYVLTTGRSASASEGLINGLIPYIEVIQIGTNTTGKTQASRTLYDSPNFEKQGANPSHTYAMQPLVANGVNKNDESVPSTGLVPSFGFEYEERPGNYGVLGDLNEPMLALALADIESSTGKFEIIKFKAERSLKILKDSNEFNPHEGGLIID
ncbi:S41 family peptidase [Sabulilitoribacter multivorans]|uniref:S41 family peptidase n=1 Tax=Flaviramulus multivorans TaxID=1304750 RepID=A0ABS9ILA6_9FLAO|nr:S41 family peptidase [Flaviramulus multivorans]MCF7561392.1 S41 family peptidase [Flaviramulus multivorans]